MRYVGWAAMLLTVLTLTAPAKGQEVPDLFEAGGPSASASRGVGQAVKRERMARLNLRALERAVAPRGVDNAANRAARAAKLQDRFRFEAFPGAAGTFRRKNVEEAVGGGFIWTGDDEGGQGGATLVVTKDQVTGHVVMGGRTFRIEPQSGNVHRIIEVDIQALPPDAPHQHAPAGPRAGGSQPTASGAPATADAGSTSQTTASTAPTISAAGTTTTPVYILVGYTARANNAPGDIRADINLALSLTNQAFANSGVLTRLYLAGTALVSGYDETRWSYDATLYNLTGVTGGGSTDAGRRAFAGLRSKRDTLRADLVTLIREGGAYCGQGWVINYPSSSYSRYAYTQVSRANCISGYALAHEVGHNMGLNHDRYVETAAATSAYNYGYVNLTKRVRDIMSYPNLCSRYNAVCTVLNRFSNPRQFVDGMRFGIAQYSVGAADASRRLNETRTGVSRFR